MASTAYPYVKAVDGFRLEKEIRDSVDITVALESIGGNATNVTVWMKAALSGAEETALDAIVAAHVNTPLEENQEQVVVIEEEGEQKTGKRFQASTFDVPIEAGTAGAMTCKEFTYPIPICILAAQISPSAYCVGDWWELHVAPDTVIGSLASDVTAGDTEIFVSQTVLDNTAVGYFLKLADGTNTDDLGRVIEVRGSSVVVETAAVNGFAAATPTYVKQTIKMIYDYKIFQADRITIGESKVGGSYVPAGTVLRVCYTNETTGAKEFNAKVEYLY